MGELNAWEAVQGDGGNLQSFQHILDNIQTNVTIYYSHTHSW